VELLPGEELPIPEWQKKEVRKRLKDLQKNPHKPISWDDAVKKIKQLAK
jgi:Putative addiction module component